jgi:diaminopimelate epimerase
MKIITHLISGAGNTFHIVDEKVGVDWSISRKKEFAEAICKELPADGFIFLKRSPLTWDFYNNDGSEAEMCGNATRCVGFFLSEIQHDQHIQWTLRTTAGPIEIEKVASGQYKVKMTPIVEKNSTKGYFCDTGVPHLVLEIEDIKHYPQLKKAAQALRFDPEFLKGTNVTYVQFLPAKNQVKAVSFERGVEDFTQACGTGAMAAAAFNFRKRGVIETEVEMPGGILKMSLADLQQPVMIGPAHLLGKYEYEYTIRSKN